MTKGSRSAPPGPAASGSARDHAPRRTRRHGPVQFSISKQNSKTSCFRPSRLARGSFTSPRPAVQCAPQGPAASCEPTRTAKPTRSTGTIDGARPRENHGSSPEARGPSEPPHEHASCNFTESRCGFGPKPPTSQYNLRLFCTANWPARLNGTRKNDANCRRQVGILQPTQFGRRLTQEYS